MSANTAPRTTEVNSPSTADAISNKMRLCEFIIVIPGRNRRTATNLRIYGAVLSRTFVETEGVAVEQTLYYDTTDTPVCLTLVERRHREFSIVTVRRYAVDAVAAVFAGVDALAPSLLLALHAARSSTEDAARMVSELVMTGSSDIINPQSVPTNNNPHNNAPEVALHNYMDPPVRLTLNMATDAFEAAYVSEEVTVTATRHEDEEDDSFHDDPDDDPDFEV
jgi:hypothetical protein